MMGRPQTTLPRRDQPENRLDDIAGFLARWDAPTDARSAGWYTLARSPYGNINTSGLPADYVAPDVTPHDADWTSAIEPGVLPIVRTLVSDHHFVTYTSCEGHDYRPSDLPAAYRQVGVLPRDPAEAQRVADVLTRLVAAVTDAAELPSEVRVIAWRATLDCAASGRAVPVFDLTVEPAPNVGLTEYFAALDRATVVVTRALESIARGEPPPQR